MVERRRAAPREEDPEERRWREAEAGAAAPRPVSPRLPDRLELKKKLRITDDIDASLAEQPEAFEDVAEGVALAVARRDALKLKMSTVIAKADARIRADYNAREEKYTEAAVSRQVETDEEVEAARLDHQEASAEADLWSALKESFGQRSYMLRELTALTIARMAGPARGGLRDDLAGARYDANNRERETRGGYPRRGQRDSD